MVIAEDSGEVVIVEVAEDSVAVIEEVVVAAVEALVGVAVATDLQQQSLKQPSSPTSQRTASLRSSSRAHTVKCVFLSSVV